jgi:ABC-type dipeptide/oligopeptide/nickel transport system permease component
VRTAFAKGLTRRRVIGRHAARPAHLTVVSLVVTQVRMLVTNLVLVEYVFFLPGFFLYTKRALGQDTPRWPPVPDIPSLQALAVWMAALILLVSLVAELLLGWLDPRIRDT